ncbi:MAG: TRAP transporter substrate-binding protein DctP [Desulfobulbus sp.]|jgi:TRAP-type C4-dicarboxylate transport system substrate-binding protein|uniref:TRAP transporter substrate-binding protein DctP n=1 Tax=Desulfobulbus sp. TaxID=895 RepID=UPI002847FFBA|nr:TRAP transporter substrate-binding protein DctP [Desulfobulbus sp.]MDR2549530.1 TRAP transporter substrate-binding protein DctP [Desulfobulbus sp.]
MKKMILNQLAARTILYTIVAVMCLASVVHSAYEENGVIQIKAATPPHVITHRLSKDAYQLFGNEVEKRTHGKVKFTWFFGDSLIKPSQSYEALRTGVVDLVIVAAYLFPDDFTITEGLSLPFTMHNSAHAADVAWKMYKAIPEMQQEMKGFKFLGIFTSDVLNLHSTDGRLFRTLDEMKNIRAAVGSGSVAQMGKLFGMEPQLVGYPEVYMALQRDLASAAFFPNAPLRSFRVTELTNAHTIANFKVDPMIIAMRQETWNALPPEVQRVFDELTPSFARLCGHTLTNEGAWVLEELKKRGDLFYTPPVEEVAKWKQAIKPMYDVWINRLDVKGLNGKAIFEKMIEMSEQTKVIDTPEDAWWSQGRIGKKSKN